MSPPDDVTRSRGRFLWFYAQGTVIPQRYAVGRVYVLKIGPLDIRFRTPAFKALRHFCFSIHGRHDG